MTSMGYPREIGKMELQGPQRIFAGLLGQEKAKVLLGRSLAAGRTPHAYLFRGPDGVGKQLFARRVAATLNCRQKGDGAACGICPSCLKFRSGNHPDFIVIRPEQGGIKIDRIRELIRTLSYPPYESAVRIVLLEDIHTMRREAANSLLKTLEEPPENNLLILTVESSKSILPTISSRCQCIPFFSLSLEETVKILSEQAEGLEEKTSIMLARLSEGSPGRALLFKESEMVETWEKVITVITDSSVHGDDDCGLLLQTAEIMAGLKENLLPFLGLLRIWIRDALISSSGREQPEGTSENIQWSSRALRASGSGELFGKLRAIDRAEQELERNCNRTLVCEILLFRLQKSEKNNNELFYDGQ
jgi:DNA polymerase III subunit delta'